MRCTLRLSSRGRGSESVRHHENTTQYLDQACSPLMDICQYKKVCRVKRLEAGRQAGTPRKEYTCTAHGTGARLTQARGSETSLLNYVKSFLTSLLHNHAFTYPGV